MSRLFDRIATGIGRAVDEAVLAATRAPLSRRTPRSTSGPSRSRLLDEATAFYRRPDVLSGEAFFLPPPRPRPHEQRVALLPDGEIVDVTWPSPFEPRWEPARGDYLRHERNRSCWVRMLRHATPRPSLICLHGYSAGHWFIEERSFLARWLYRVGLDVSLFVLPFHAQRAVRSGPPPWPSPNVARTNEGFAHAMYDLQAFARWLRERGAPSVSACGMSLGGFSTALLATVEPLDFAAMMIPVASFAELFWTHGAGRPELRSAMAEGITLARVKAALEVTTPLSRRPLLDAERVLVIDAEGDRIAPREHAEWLAGHFGARRITLPGGHVLLHRGAPLKAIVRRMQELAIFSREGA